VPAYVGGRKGISATGYWLIGNWLRGKRCSQMFGDELAVEATVFDEDFVGSLAGDDDSGKIDTGNVALKCGGVADGAASVGLVEGNSQTFNKAEVGVIAGEGEDELVGQDDFAFGSCQIDVVFVDPCDVGAEVGLDLAVLDAIVDVGEDPILDVPVHLGAAVNKGDLRTVTP